MRLREAHSWTDVETAKEQSYAKGQIAAKHTMRQLYASKDNTITTIDPRGKEVAWALRDQLQEVVPAFFSTYGIRMRLPEDYKGRPLAYWNHVVKPGLDWFDETVLLYQDEFFVPPAHNLVVNSGLHISAQRTFTRISPNHGNPLTAVSGSTNSGVRYGGADNSTTPVSATTNQFDITGSNRFIAEANSDPTYSTTNKRITMFWTITQTAAIDHRRYGQTNDSANAANTLFSMISGFLWQPGSNNYDWTIESRTDWAGA